MYWCETIEIEVADPVMLGVIMLPLELALTELEDGATDGAGGRTVILAVAVLDVPPGPCAANLKLSVPL